MRLNGGSDDEKATRWSPPPCSGGGAPNPRSSTPVPIPRLRAGSCRTAYARRILSNPTLPVSAEPNEPVPFEEARAGAP